MKKIIDIKDLRTYFFIESEDREKVKLHRNNPLLKKYYDKDKSLRNKIPAKAVDGVSFEIYEGEVLGIVGESGSGKSVTAYSINRLIPDPPGKIISGEIIFKETDLLRLSIEEMRKYRGKEIAMIFQEPMTSLNPVLKIETQISEVILQHEKVGKSEAVKRSIEMMELVGIPDSAKRIKEYPHKFSGGMRQRVMIAMALACNPSLLIADEPTTALDVTIQAQILELMLRIKNIKQDSAIILITHNLGIVAEICRKVLVMYGGKIQEKAVTGDIFNNPLHPYTRGLLESLPDPDKKVMSIDSDLGKQRKKLVAIPGLIPNILDLPDGCKFCTRCKDVMDVCKETEPELIEKENGHFVRCHLYN
ncbi:MAG: ABC transporter ATP-binding protein [Ignavibacteria bacterium]|nr:ABC transporter ATP-binding protein [Ignavibacteria bacterium]